MAWTIHFNKTAKENLENLGHAAKTDILKQIKKKLTVDPIAYGNPLTGPLAGQYKLRVGDYRVLYRISEQGNVVIVSCVDHRSVVYKPKR